MPRPKPGNHRAGLAKPGRQAGSEHAGFLAPDGVAAITRARQPRPLRNLHDCLKVVSATFVCGGKLAMSEGRAFTNMLARALAVALASASPRGAVLADLCGDGAAVLGLPEPDGPGLSDWLAAGGGKGSWGNRGR